MYRIWQNELSKNPRYNVIYIAPGPVDTDIMKLFLTNQLKELGIYDDFLKTFPK
jgi:hypothetical protein